MVRMTKSHAAVIEYADMMRGFAQRTGCDSPTDLRTFALGVIEGCAKHDDLDGVKAALAALKIVLDEHDGAIIHDCGLNGGPCYC